MIDDPHLKLASYDSVIQRNKRAGNKVDLIDDPNQKWHLLLLSISAIKELKTVCTSLATLIYKIASYAPVIQRNKRAGNKVDLINDPHQKLASYAPLIQRNKIASNIIDLSWTTLI